MADIQTLVSAAETAITTYNNNTALVTTDQQRISDAQAKLVADQATATQSGADAYTAVSAVITAFQTVLSTLPAPVPAVVPPPAA